MWIISLREGNGKTVYDTYHSETKWAKQQLMNKAWARAGGPWQSF